MEREIVPSYCEVVKNQTNREPTSRPVGLHVSLCVHSFVLSLNDKFFFAKKPTKQIRLKENQHSNMGDSYAYAHVQGKFIFRH